jgi:Ni,Fe-hydrogenase III component G
VNAPGFVVSPDDIQSVLFDLRDEGGFDHLSCVTAQEYQGRYETIYHLTSYDERAREVDIVVPAPKDDPRNESATPVYSTAGWHEREAYDLVDIEYDVHPDLRRFLLPETWQDTRSLWIRTSVATTPTATTQNSTGTWSPGMAVTTTLASSSGSRKSNSPPGSSPSVWSS